MRLGFGCPNDGGVGGVDGVRCVGFLGGDDDDDLSDWFLFHRRCSLWLTALEMRFPVSVSSLKSLILK